MVIDAMTAAEAYCRNVAQAYGKGAEALITPGGPLTNGGQSFFVEIWTRRRSRLAASLAFAIVPK